MKKWEVKVVRTKARIANIGLAKWWLDVRIIGSFTKPWCGSAGNTTFKL
jgi:hypothetical protein